MNARDDLVGHLTELRKRLIAVVLVFAVALGAGLYESPRVLAFLKSRAAASNVEWHVFSLTDGLYVYLRCAFLIAAMVALPFALYQAWAFARPGLTEREAKGTLACVPASFALFASGLTFGYYVVFPMMLRVMKEMNENVGATETYGIERYFSFLFNVLFPLGLAFEMPIVMLFLARLGVIHPARMKNARKFAYVGLAVVGSCISPPDFVSHLSVTVPLIALFEISVLFAARMTRNRERPLAGPPPAGKIA